MKRPTIYLFDIDGTLVTTGGVGRRALEQAFAQRYGTSGYFDFGFDGMTDRAIVAVALRSLLAAGPLPFGEIKEAGKRQHDLESEIDAVLDAYVRALEAETRAASASFIVHEGAHAVLDAIDATRAHTAFALGLGTGNIRRGAEIKLGAVGLYQRFAFGGFGCDHEERPAILAAGAARGAALLGRDRSACDVLVIGDTPKDVAAAHAIGAACLGVATGRFSEQELRDSGADFTAPTLASAQARRVLKLM